MDIWCRIFLRLLQKNVNTLLLNLIDSTALNYYFFLCCWTATFSEFHIKLKYDVRDCNPFTEMNRFK